MALLSDWPVLVNLRKSVPENTAVFHACIIKFPIHSLYQITVLIPLPISYNLNPVFNLVEKQSDRILPNFGFNFGTYSIIFKVISTKFTRCRANKKKI